MRAVTDKWHNQPEIGSTFLHFASVTCTVEDDIYDIKKGVVLFQCVLELIASIVGFSFKMIV